MFGRKPVEMLVLVVILADDFLRAPGAVRGLIWEGVLPFYLLQLLLFGGCCKHPYLHS